MRRIIPLFCIAATIMAADAPPATPTPPATTTIAATATAVMVGAAIGAGGAVAIGIAIGPVATAAGTAMATTWMWSTPTR